MNARIHVPYRVMHGRLVLFAKGFPPEILGHFVWEMTGYRLVKPCLS